MLSNISKKTGEKERSYSCHLSKINGNTEHFSEPINEIAISKIQKINHPKIKWYRMVIRGKPNHSLLMIDLIGMGNLKDYARKIYKFNYQINYYRQLDGSRWISEKDRFALNKLFSREINKNPKFLYKLAVKIEKIGFKIIALANKYKKINWERRSNKELISVFEKFSDLESRLYGGDFWFYGWHLFFNDIYLKNFKADSENNLKRENWAYIIKPKGYLIMPEKACFSCQERSALFKLAKKFLKRKNVPRKYIKKHLNKFAFVNKNYFRGEGFTYKEIHDELKELIKSGEKNIDKKIEAYKIKKLNLDGLSLPSSQEFIIKGFRKMAYVSSIADEATNYYTYHLKPLFNEIIKRLKIDYEEFLSMRFQEIKESLEINKINISRQQLRERFTDYALIFAKNNINILSGENLKKYKPIELNKEIKKDISEFKGTTTFKINKPIKGHVIIIKNRKKLDPFKKNSILVAETTCPDRFLPVIKKAKAIVTDEGGLLCHTAIISREFGIPCIVGTKIATWVLNNGDFVEVDTNNGIVKILNRVK